MSLVRTYLLVLALFGPFVGPVALAAPKARPAKAEKQTMKPRDAGVPRAGLRRRPKPPSAKQLRSHFGNLPGTFVFHDPQRRRTVRVYPYRARTRFTPCSTFKVPNSLIALTSKVAKDTRYFIAWDQKRDPNPGWWPKAWARDQTMATALPESVVWYYQELARRIGGKRMWRYVHQLRYGNMRTEGGIDCFWISDTLRISANEQLDFMRRFYRGRLEGIPRRHIKLLKPLLVLERGPGWVLSGKTGACPGHDKHFLGWLIGYLEREIVITRNVGTRQRRRKVKRVYFYAMNISGYNYAAVAPKRLSVTKAILQDLGVLPRPLPAKTAQR